MRVTVISKSNWSWQTSVKPVTGAALAGSAVQASGMWPSPASRPEVGVQPDPAGAGDVGLAPGVQVGEVLRPVPTGPSSDFMSAASWIR